MAPNNETFVFDEIWVYFLGTVSDLRAQIFHNVLYIFEDDSELCILLGARKITPIFQPTEDLILFNTMKGQNPFLGIPKGEKILCLCT